jgi:hypothetical protein
VRFGLSYGDRVRLTGSVRSPIPIDVGQVGVVCGFCEAPGLERVIVEWDGGVWHALRPMEDSWERVPPDGS